MFGTFLLLPRGIGVVDPKAKALCCPLNNQLRGGGETIVLEISKAVQHGSASVDQGNSTETDFTSLEDQIQHLKFKSSVFCTRTCPIFNLAFA